MHASVYIYYTGSKWEPHAQRNPGWGDNMSTGAFLFVVRRCQIPVYSILQHELIRNIRLIKQI